MTGDLAGMIRDICGEATAYVGVGNSDRCDDGVGSALVHLLEKDGIGTVFDGGTNPELLLSTLKRGGFATVVFCDAVDAGLEPGSVVLMDTRDIVYRYPQVSTHKISLGTIAELLRAEGGPDVFLLGIQPESIDLHPGKALSAPVEKTLKLLAARIREATTGSHPSGRRQLHAV